MMENRERILAWLITVAGAAAAFFGVRGLVRWMQSRSHNERRQTQIRQRMQRQVSERLEGVSQPASYQPVDQPDRQPIPATGTDVATPEVEEITRVMNESAYPVTVGEMVSPLAQYLLGFRSLIELLRSRRRENGGAGSGRSLTLDDRGQFQETLDRLEELIPDYGAGNLEENSLQERIYRLTVKVRDAVQNTSYTDDDLFRINGEVRTEACRVLDEIQSAGAGTGDDFYEARQVYECG